MIRGHRVGALIIAAVFVFNGAACSSGAVAPSARIPPLVSVAASPSGVTSEPVAPASSPTPQVAESLGAASYPTTKAGAYALAHDYILEAYRAVLIRDTTRLGLLQTPACRCRSAVSHYVHELKIDKEHVVGFNSTVQKVDGFSASGNAAQIAVTHSDAAGTVVTDSGLVAQRGSGAKGIRDVLTLVAVAGQWKVASITRIDDGT